MPAPAFTSLLHLVEVTRSVRPREVDPWIKAERSFAPWSRHERQLVQALRKHQRSHEEIAAVVERTPKAIRMHLEERKPLSLEDLPSSPLGLCTQDVELLSLWHAPPVRDPLGWLPSGSLPKELWQPADEPTLRIIFVRRDQSLGIFPLERGAPRYWPLVHADLEMGAQGTWMDLAAQLVHRGGQVLMPPEDVSYKQRRTLRSALQRTAGTVPPRLSVIDMTVAADVQQQADLVLIDRPALWPALIRNVTARTVLLVLPELRSPEELAPYAREGKLPHVSPQHAGHSDLPLSVRYGEDAPDDWLRQALLAWHAQQAVIDRWRQGRVLEVHRVTGVTHTSGVPARLDWPAVRLLPGQGQVVAGTEELLLRAAAWYQITSKREVALPEQVFPRVSWVAPVVHGLSQHKAPLKLAEHYQSRPFEDQVMGRVWLDVLYSPVEGSATLQFVQADHEVMTYIGR